MDVAMGKRTTAEFSPPVRTAESSACITDFACSSVSVIDLFIV
jgi:hypothetical protein